MKLLKVTSLQAIDALQILELECQLHVKNLFQSTFSQRPSWPTTSYEIRKLQAAEVQILTKRFSETTCANCNRGKTQRAAYALDKVTIFLSFNISLEPLDSYKINSFEC